MDPQKISIVSVPHLVSIKGPLPLNVEVLSPGLEAVAVEQIGQVPIGNDGGPPPVGENLSRGGHAIISVGRKRILIVVRVKLHEQTDLPQTVEAGDSLPFLLRLAERREEHAGKNGNDGDDHK